MNKRLSVALSLVLLGVPVACRDEAARGELEKLEAQAATEARNKEVVRAYFSAIDRNDFGKLQELSASDFSLPVPALAQPLGLDGLLQAIRTHYAAFPDWTHAIEDIVAEGDKVAVRVFMKGTHKGEFEGIPPTEKSLTMHAQCLLVVAGGKVKELRVVEDYQDFYRQLGMELKPKEMKTKGRS